MDMEKSKLIATILSEVKDQDLRDRLLKQVAEENEVSSLRPNDSDSPSLVLSELEKLGIDQQAAKGLIGYQLKVGVFIGYLVGGLFFIGGTTIALANFFDGRLFTAIFASFFVVMGALALVTTRKLARLHQPKEKK